MKIFVLILLLITTSSTTSEAQDHTGHTQSADEPEVPAPQPGSGTGWLPASSPMEMIHFNSGAWAFMVHGFANFAYQEESEPRGTSEFFSTNMAMFSAGRGVGQGRFNVRFMGTLEPTLGSDGYPLLLQTGETADGINPLFDRQHPHDLFMEVALRYDRPFGEADAFFVYFAPVGDPAIGPSAFMHRFSGVDNPVAPLAHHWLDSTHISYGVVTAGWSRANTVLLEGSVFNGREPDADRWDVDAIQLNSFSTRITVNPTPNWAIQGSMGWLKEPEILHPDQDLLRMTASVTYNRPLGASSRWGNWQTTAAWGRNKWDEPPATAPLTGHIHFTPGVQPTRNAVLAETGIRFMSMHTVFARWEWAEKDELFISADRRHQLVYDVTKLSAGYLIDFLRLSHLRVGAGVYGALHWVPRDLDIVYGGTPSSVGFFLRLKIT
jgi:hypothetical protein